jgi:GT2 family glycosyltransferase
VKKNWNPLARRSDFSPKQTLEPISIESARNLFDAKWYERMYLDSSEYPEDSWVHFLSFGAKNGYDPNEMFDTDWYLAQYPEIAETNENPLVHYVRIGAYEGKDPNPFFSSTYYLNENPDIKSLGVNPLQHFLEFGYGERRIPFRNSWPNEIAPWKNESEVDKSDTAIDSQKKIAIVIPVFNNWYATERCLRAIQSTNDIHLADIVVVNDGSTDDTLLQLKRFPSIRVIDTSVNMGFTKACNFAFKQLKDYEFVFLLNNDTEVLNGFLSNSLALMKTHPKVAIVGSILVSPDGTLQECGAIVWSDGTTHNFGRGRNLGHMEVRFSRQVDYCSGAGLLIRNDLLNEVGLFDERFAPAYYEDTDLSFKLREIGYEVWVCHSSRVIHHEGLSHGNNAMILANTNQDKFITKWEAVLKAHPKHSNDPDHLQRAAMRHTKYADSEIISSLTELLWGSKHQI